MEPNSVEVGMQVTTSANLGDTKGMIVKQQYLDARQPNKVGKVIGCVPGGGGEVWWVSHADGTTGAYVFNEFNPV